MRARRFGILEIGAVRAGVKSLHGCAPAIDEQIDPIDVTAGVGAQQHRGARQIVRPATAGGGDALHQGALSLAVGSRLRAVRIAPRATLFTVTPCPPNWRTRLNAQLS